MAAIEIWKDIPGYEELYQISNKGIVKSFKRIKTKLLKPGLLNSGYYNATLKKDGKNKQFRIHQLVAMAFLNHQISGMENVVDHINGIKTDNRVENLQIITARQNIYKAKIKKHLPQGVSEYRSKTNKFEARIYNNKKSYVIGRFHTQEEASQAYQQALKQIN
jgi:hypothetical protein